jgi:NAD(P)H-flavin reductase
MTVNAAETNANPWLSRAARIVNIIPETSHVCTYELALEDPTLAENFRFRPGQFNMLYIPGVGEAAISISGSPSDTHTIPHTIRLAGNVTQALAELPIGASIGVRGPFGSSWPVSAAEGRDVVLVAGGIGLAPLRPVIRELLNHRERFGRLTLIAGARSPEALLYTTEYEQWEAQGMGVHITVDQSSRDWHGHLGTVTAVLDRIPLPNPENTLLMTCGPEVMMWYTVQGSMQRGLSPGLIYVSLERNMNCAIGLCGHCQFGPEFLCRDGPVFRYDRVASILKVEDL